MSRIQCSDCVLKWKIPLCQATVLLAFGFTNVRASYDRVPHRRNTARHSVYSSANVGTGITSSRAKFEPSTGCYLGAYIDFDGMVRGQYVDANGTRHRLPASFERIVGKSHAMYFFYLGYGRPLPLDWVQMLGQRGKLVHIALEPNGGLDKVKDDGYLHKLALDMRKCGTPIFLRFASEMNGNWTNYHGNPALYRQKFRLVHNVMTRLAPNVAMVWCPFVWPSETMANYYPGDDATDWVGINLYSVLYHNNSRKQSAEHESPTSMLSYIYSQYSDRKPIMVCEYGVSHQSVLDRSPRPDFAAAKIRNLYDAARTRYPRVKCINYFDSDNIKFVPRHPHNDYSLTSDPFVLAAYRDVISSQHFIGDFLKSDPRLPIK